MSKGKRSRRRSEAQKREAGRRSRTARRHALEALALMRTKHLSPTPAAKEAQTTLKSMLKYVASALSKQSNGRYRAKPSDRILRRLNFLTPEGQIELEIRSSRTASKIARYSAGVDHYLKTGDNRALNEFRGASVRAGKQRYFFITDPVLLGRLAAVGEVSYEDLYAS